ncbi:hypothetical protein N9C66_06910, partial [Akkermansiaceae bacterium]|nr:hypothetical protein [Akkermansiaceae bacterium]MDB4383128.1 hypothetical protein [Akkermansiaceae bacterium]
FARPILIQIGNMLQKIFKIVFVQCDGIAGEGLLPRVVSSCSHSGCCSRERISMRDESAVPFQTKSIPLRFP